MALLTDRCGRTLTYLRVSLTDRCNLRCRYCMPEEGVPEVPHEEILSFEEVERLCALFSLMGIRKVRFTGGEPLVRRGVLAFLASFRRQLPHLRCALTTNGLLLAPMAPDLLSLGLAGINVSLDTLNHDKYRYITRWGDLNQVFRGIEAVQGHIHIKINTVLIRGFNEGEIESLVHFAKDHGATLRFIEFMPLDGSVWSPDSFLSAEDMRLLLPDPGNWRPEESFPLIFPEGLTPEGEGVTESDAGPAKYYRHVHTGQRVGTIAAVSSHFCRTCNRLRLSATGDLRTCLFQNQSLSLREALRAGDDSRVMEMVREAVRDKPLSWQNLRDSERHMSRIGG
ncbi:MAG TPA: GTP 3',8-cyclase MoaA [Synergistaceae bacterium]|nr:GTP 3',8-cyclase MoaA [Synergistaceae bacterium]